MIGATSTSALEGVVERMLRGEMPESEMQKIFEEYQPDTLSSHSLAGAVRAMRRAMVPVELTGNPVDTCGTGGSGRKTINTSTLAAFIVAAARGKIAKHGNRSASGNCGCFDVLEALGAKIDLTVEQEQKIHEELGIVFLFARSHHPAMRHVAAARKAFGRKTLFNLLGPLCNPASVRRQLIGTGHAHDAQLMADTLHILHAQEQAFLPAFVVQGMDGLDEISVCAPTIVHSVNTGERNLIVPADMGLPVHALADIAGGSVSEKLHIFREIAAGKGTDAHRNLVIANAAHALLLAEITDNLRRAGTIAAEVLASGRVMTLIERYVSFTRDV